MQHTASHTTAVQFSSHYQWYILISKQWYQLPEFILLSNPSLSLSPLFRTLSSGSASTHSSNHSHLCQLNCHLIFLSYRPGLTSMQRSTSHTTAVQSPSHYQWYILIGKQWYLFLSLFHPIQILVSTASSASPSTLNMSLNNKTYLLTPDLHCHQHVHSTLVHRVAVTGFTQPLQTNDFICTCYRLCQ